MGRRPEVVQFHFSGVSSLRSPSSTGGCCRGPPAGIKEDWVWFNWPDKPTSKMRNSIRWAVGNATDRMSFRINVKVSWVVYWLFSVSACNGLSQNSPFFFVKFMAAQTMICFMTTEAEWLSLRYHSNGIISYRNYTNRKIYSKSLLLLWKHSEKSLLDITFCKYNRINQSSTEKLLKWRFDRIYYIDNSVKNLQEFNSIQTFKNYSKMIKCNRNQLHIYMLAFHPSFPCITQKTLLFTIIITVGLLYIKDNRYYSTCSYLLELAMLVSRDYLLYNQSSSKLLHLLRMRTDCERIFWRRRGKTL